MLCPLPWWEKLIFSHKTKKTYMIILQDMSLCSKVQKKKLYSYYQSIVISSFIWWKTYDALVPKSINCSFRVKFSKGYKADAFGLLCMNFCTKNLRNNIKIMYWILILGKWLLMLWGYWNFDIPNLSWSTIEVGYRYGLGT